jgi:flagellar hook-associated protein 2
MAQQERSRYQASSPTRPRAVVLRTIQDGKDASLLVDGVQLTSASNSVTDAVPGVTFQLLSVPDVMKNVQVVIANDTVSVASAVSTLVTDYNKVIHSITAQEGKDSSGNAEPLYGSTLLARVQQSLQAALGATFSSGSVRSAYSLGIASNPDGTISLNTDTLNSVLNTKFAEVASFFQDSGGFGIAFSTSLNNMGNGFSTGMISLALKENKSQEETLNDDVARQESLIATQNCD